MNKCLKCGTLTDSKTRTVAPIYTISLCRDHRNISADREILAANKKARFDFSLSKEESMPELLKTLKLRQKFSATATEVYQYYYVKKEIVPVTPEIMETEYKQYLESKDVKNV